MKYLVLFSCLWLMMSAEQITGLINQKAEQGASPESLWNLGFQIFHRQGFPRREAVLNLVEGYGGASGVSEEQEAAVRKAEAFWQHVYQAWDSGMKRRADRPGHIPAFPTKAPSYFKDPLPLPMSPAPASEK